MRRLQDDIDHLFGGAGMGRGWPAWSGESERAAWAPAVEAFHRGNEFVVRADVPGLSREDLSVEIGEDTLTLSGERKYNRDEEREGVFTNERSYGSFYRVIPLPEGAVADSAKANFKDGVLEIVVQTPPHEVRRGRRVEINQENPARAGQ
jgi:HSP20 family protein